VLRRCQHLLCQKKTKCFDVVSISCARRRPSAPTLSASHVPEEDQILRHCQHLLCHICYPSCIYDKNLHSC
jgi:hypothetical protein